MTCLALSAMQLGSSCNKAVACTCLVLSVQRWLVWLRAVSTQEGSRPSTGRESSAHCWVCCVMVGLCRSRPDCLSLLIVYSRVSE